MHTSRIQRQSPAFWLALAALCVALAAMAYALLSGGSSQSENPLANFKLSAADIAKGGGGKRIHYYAGFVKPGHTDVAGKVGPFKVEFTCNDGGSSGEAGWRIHNVGAKNAWGDGDDGSDGNFDKGEKDVLSNDDFDSGDGMGAISRDRHAVVVDTEVSRDANSAGEPATNKGCLGAAAVINAGKN
jgi:hypothetical protein